MPRGALAIAHSMALGRATASIGAFGPLRAEGLTVTMSPFFEARLPGQLAAN